MRRGGGAGGGGNGVSIADDGVEEMRQSNGISDYQRQGDASQTANGGAPDEANVSAYPPIGDEEEPGVDRYARPVSKLNFYAGCFLAFLSGFLTMFNNFLIKETGSDFGELIAIRSLLQIAAMLALSKVMGLAVIPRSHLDKVLLLIMGLFGGLTMISAYSCIRFMPVADAMTLVFTNPLFTLIFELLFFGTKLSVIKGLGGS